MFLRHGPRVALQCLQVCCEASSSQHLNMLARHFCCNSRIPKAAARWHPSPAIYARSMASYLAQVT